MAGVKQLIDYLSSLEFSKEDIEFLRSKNMFCEKFLDYLSVLNLNAMSGPYRRELLFSPNEPIVTVRGPIIQAQFVETMVLLTINHQSLIATKVIV